MAGQLLDHPLAVHFALDSVMEDVEPDEAGQQILVFHQPVALAAGRGLVGTSAMRAMAPATAEAAPNRKTAGWPIRSQSSPATRRAMTPLSSNVLPDKPTPPRSS